MATSMSSIESYAGKTPDQLEREINQTREHVDETVRALVDRLSPGQLVDQGLDYFRRSDAADGARTFALNLGRALRDNPIPAVMITAGFVWLAASNGSRQNRMHRSYDSRVEGGSMRDSLSEWSESASDLKDRAAERASEMVGRASDLKDSATDTVRRLRDRSVDLTHRSRETMDRARQSWQSVLHEQPLVLGLAGVVIGALIGAALPPTEQEDRWVGEARDTALAKAGEAGRELAGEMKDQARDLTSRVQDEATRAMEAQTGSEPRRDV